MIDAITIGTLNVGVGASSVDPTTVTQGGLSQITFQSLGTVATGGTITFNGGNVAGPSLGDNPNVKFTVAPTLTNGLIGPWATVSTGLGTTLASFATYDPATGIRPLNYTAGQAFGSGINTLLTGSLTLPAPIGVATTITTNSLSASSGGPLTFTNYNDTLLIQSGGIVTNQTLAFGTTIVPGQLRSGAGADLSFNISSNQNSVVVNSKIIDNGSNNNVIVSGMGMGNAGILTLTNANTYGGTMYLDGAQINLNSLVGPAIPGNIVVSGGADHRD